MASSGSDQSVHDSHGSRAPSDHNSTQAPHARDSRRDETISRMQAALTALERTLQNSTTLPNREKLTAIRTELMSMIQKAESYNPYDDVSIDVFYHSLSSTVIGTVGWRTVDSDVSVTQVKNMFGTHYINKRVVRAYRVTFCTDDIVAPFIYPRWLAAHHMWPQKDEVPLYFCKQLFAEFHLGYDVDYTDLPPHAGQGRGRYQDKCRRPDIPQPPSKRALVGQNLLVLPKGLEAYTGAGQVAAEDTRLDMYSSIATIATQVEQFSSDRVGRYMLRSRTSAGVSPSSPFYDPYIRFDLPTPDEIGRLPEDRVREISGMLVSDLLAAYQRISTLHGIEPRDLPTFIGGGQCRRSSTGSSRGQSSDAEAGSSRQSVDDLTPPPQHTQAPTQHTQAPTQQTQATTSRVHSRFSDLLMDDAIDPDAMSLHSSELSDLGRALQQVQESGFNFNLYRYTCVHIVLYLNLNVFKCGTGHCDRCCIWRFRGAC